MEAPPPELAKPQGAPGIMRAATQLLEARPLLAGRYFEALTRGAMSRDGFLRSQQQFFFAVRFFSRPIAALVSRIPDSAGRMDLVHNLAEEQGDFDPAQAHDRTFQAFLRSVGVSERQFAAEQEGPAVQAFNHALLGTCLGADTDLAFGCLGIIELAFADISALIGRTVVERGWVAYEDLVHYKLHAEIDKRHAEEFFEVIEAAYQQGGSAARQIGAGLALGHHVFGRFYDDLAGLAVDS